MKPQLFSGTTLGSAGNGGMETMGVSYKDESKLVVREGQFRLMDLPAELRVYIYSFLLPYNVFISLMVPRWYGDPWIIEATTKKDRDPVSIAIGNQSWRRSCIRSRLSKDKLLQVQTQLFLVNKEIANEARRVLYGSNTYEFIIKGNGDTPFSRPSPKTFDPFDDRNGLALPQLRNMRSIHVELYLNYDGEYAFKRQRACLEHIMNMLKQHSEDDDRRSLLQELKIRVLAPFETWHSWTDSFITPRDKEQFMFTLEPLVTLRDIKHMQVKGVPEWYAQCLQLCVQGKGGEILETNWPRVKAKSTAITDRCAEKIGNSWVTTRKWYQPTLNWKEFAQRNGIVIPADIDKYWTVENSGGSDT